MQSDTDNINWSDEAPILYHSAFENSGFSRQFRDRYWELAGGDKPTSWPHDHVRIDNRTSIQVVQDIGIEACGKGLTIAIIPRRALPALRILDTDGCEYPHLDPDTFVVHYVQQHFKQGHGSIGKAAVTALVAESKMLHIKIISRGKVSPAASTSNRYSCLSC